MGRTCRLVRAGRTVEAQWRRDAGTLLISPASGPPLAVALEAVAGIGGDGHTITLRLPAEQIALERLGADGPTLLGELGREWPPLRAGVLRLLGGGAPGEVFAGTLESGGARAAFRGFFVGERLVLAPEGGDCSALFAADCASVDFDEAAYAVRLTAWDGVTTSFTRLGGRTDAFCAAFRAARERLARAAERTVEAHLPTLGAAARTALAGRWLPGCVLSFAALEELAPGFAGSFVSAWLAGCPRAAEGAKLMEGVAPADRFLGYAGAATGDEASLWLLAGTGGTWRLELLSHDDYATYLFQGGGEVPRLLEGLVRFPEFSREALYLPLGELTGERAPYAVPARDLPLLRELRARFAGREIHAGGT